MHDQMRNISGRAHYHTIVTVKNGVAVASRQAEMNYESAMLQKALRGGAITYIINDSSKISASAAGTSEATLGVGVDPAMGVYRISPTWPSNVTGKEHKTDCHRETCTTEELDFPADPVPPSTIVGQIDAPNHLKGSKTDKGPSADGLLKGQQTLTVTWDLTRAK